MPSENAVRGPIKHSAQIDEAPLHRDIRRIPSPDLIRTVDAETAQEVGVDAVCLIPAAGVGLAIKGFNAHLLHQRTDMLTSDRPLLPPEHVTQPARSGKGMLQVPFVDSLHLPKIAVRFSGSTSCAYVDSDSAEIRGVTSGRLHQGKERDPSCQDLWGRGNAILWARVFG